MKYKSTLLSVKNMQRSLTFYKTVLGLRVVADFGANKMLSGGISLQTEASWKNFIDADDITYGGKSCELYFEEEDFDIFFGRLKEFDVRYVHGVKEHAWGQRVIRIYDPDDYIIEIGESMNAVCRLF